MIKYFIKKYFKPIGQDQRGATLLISALILALLTVFVSTALINTTSSSISINNDAVTKNAFYLSYAGLEKMSKEFSDIFTANLAPSQAQLDAIVNNAKALANDPNLAKNGTVINANIRNRKLVDPEIDLTNGPYSGLKALREEYIFTATTTTGSGVTVQLTRSLYNNLIPIFQFGIFSTRHLEFYNGPPFNFGGRMHSNRDVYLTPNSATKFADRVTTVGQFTYGKLRNGADRSQAVGSVQIFFPPSSSYKNLTLGSVVGGPNTTIDPRPGHPVGTSNKTSFENFIKTNLPGQVFFNAPPLKLPIQNTNNRPIEIIRRGLPSEDPTTNILAQSRFFNKAGLRISISDLQAQLPGGNGGVQLDASKDPITNVTYTDGRLGYKPQSLGAYQASRINGHRMKGWIKIETVTRLDNGSIVVNDVTKEILALGVTSYDNTNDLTELRNVKNVDPADPALQAYGNLDDRKSVIRLQRVSMLATTPTATVIGRSDGGFAGALTNNNRNNLVVNGVTQLSGNGNGDPSNPLITAPLVDNIRNKPENSDTPPIIYAGVTDKLMKDGMFITYPINMYDQREGSPLDTAGPANIPVNGVISLVDIDMQNLKRLLTGAFDPDFAAGGFSFRASNIASETNGWIIYLSDRRGDNYAINLLNPNNPPNPEMNNFGKYDHEAIYGNTNTVVAGQRRPYIPGGPNETLFEIEDTNDNGTIEFPFVDLGKNLINTEGGLPNEFIDRVDAITKGPWHPNSRQGLATGAPAKLPPPVNISAAVELFRSTGDNVTNLTRVRLDDSTVALQQSLFRRGVRLSNGTDLTASGTNSIPNNKGLNLNRGITIATENHAYVLGNYNTTNVKNTTGATANVATDYLGNEVPAAIISDSITLLSKDWRDSNSFTSPYNQGGRVAVSTQYRFAAFTGRVRDGLFVGATDTVKWGVKGTSGAIGTEPDDVRLYGGVHNFLRYLEDWGNDKLSYCGSIIDGWDSFQANGNFKCCTTVYSPPTRDYTFNTAFTSVDRLPPGTPNLQYILFTNFRENINPSQF
ncbi:MAG: hypothetical protein J0M03_13585 [Acidobacteria bacterium]|nr:hypothetical protein [Acidobacteriota bacterium]